MKILNEQSIGVQQGTDLNQDAPRTTTKDFNDLAPGDRFKAAVTDIQQGQVTIRLDSGQTLTAKSMILPEARIGEESIFMVKENFKGQILLEMIKPDSEALKSGFIREALTGAGQPATTENIELVQALMERQLPIDSETLQKALFFKYIQGEPLSLDKVLFLIEENFPMDKLNIELLNNLMENHVGLKENISSLAYEILDLPNTELKGQLLSLMAENAHPIDKKPELLPEAEELLEAYSDFQGEDFVKEDKKLKEIINLVREKLYFSLDEKKTVEDLRHYFKEVYETVKNMREAVGAASPEGTDAVLGRLAVIQESLEFIDNIGQYKEYIQLPFTFAGQEKEGELIIFKSPGKRKNYNEQASILVGLDCAYLGRVEVFISKLNNTLNMQFRLEKEETVRNMNKSFHQLAAALNQKGYSISGASFNMMTQPFRLTDKADRVESKKNTSAPRRYSFDMRV